MLYLKGSLDVITHSMVAIKTTKKQVKTDKKILKVLHVVNVLDSESECRMSKAHFGNYSVIFL